MKTPKIRALILSFLLLLCLSPLASAASHPLTTVYFTNWAVYSQEHAEVKHLPWDRLDRIYHAFWKIIEDEKGFSIVSTDSWVDIDPDNPRAHFPQYALYCKDYPNTEVLLSIGGWTYSGLFSKMALTSESRSSFIQSCLDTLDAYPFLSGIDLDWEYPGIHRRATANDEGSPMVGDDWTNYPLLLQELRAALDAHFGAGKKLLTVCAAGGKSTLGKQNYPEIYPYVDAINLMTYDLSGNAKRTGHHSPLHGTNSVESALQFMSFLHVPSQKLFIGTPLYCHGWSGIDLSAASLVGASAKGANASGDMLYKQLLLFEQEAVAEGIPGWHIGYDSNACAGYLWNDNPASPDYASFLSYENSRSLEDKLSCILENDLGGIIVWQVNGDAQDAAWPMITRMYTRLHP